MTNKNSKQILREYSLGEEKEVNRLIRNIST
jgi:hypothetical protein